MKKLSRCMVLVAMALGSAILLPRALGQETTGLKQDDTNARSAQLIATTAYRLEFVLSEISEGKKTNSRSYSLLVQGSNQLNKLRSGARVPVVTNQLSKASNPTFPTQFQYFDVGMSIDCRVREQNGSLLLNTTIDSSSFAQPMPNESSIDQPVIHQLKADVETLVGLGKPTVIASMDDPTSKRQFQLEVTATKLK